MPGQDVSGLRRCSDAGRRGALHSRRRRVANGTLLTLTAEGRSTRAPDVAEVSGGVVTTAPTAAAAMRDNAAKMTAVVAAVKKAGIADRDIQTTGLSLQPQYRYENNAPPVLTGYQATNTVSLRIRKIVETGKLLDTLVAGWCQPDQRAEFRRREAGRGA